MFLKYHLVFAACLVIFQFGFLGNHCAAADTVLTNPKPSHIAISKAWIEAVIKKQLGHPIHQRISVPGDACFSGWLMPSAINAEFCNHPDGVVLNVAGIVETFQSRLTKGNFKFNVSAKFCVNVELLFCREFYATTKLLDRVRVQLTPINVTGGFRNNKAINLKRFVRRNIPQIEKRIELALCDFGLMIRDQFTSILPEEISRFLNKIQFSLDVKHRHLVIGIGHDEESLSEQVSAITPPQEPSSSIFISKSDLEKILTVLIESVNKNIVNRPK